MAARIAPATTEDIPALLELLNRAYRGDDARAGWTHEADLIAGEQRTDASELREKLEKKNAMLLKYISSEDRIEGCVYLEQQGPDMYLGMLSVDPALQGTGIGKKLLRAGEEHAKARGCGSVVMTVISVRSELISWYARHGYEDTGVEEPFPEDPRFGKPRQPLFFRWLRKNF